MKIYILFIAFIFFPVIGMELGEQAKQDKVSRLDLKGILATIFPIICKVSSPGMLGCVDAGEFSQERSGLVDVATKPHRAGAIKPLFTKWPALKHHWASRSMLLHAVQAHALANAFALLEQGIDPQARASYFFQTHNLEKTPTEVVLGDCKTHTNPHPNIELATALMGKISQFDQTMGTVCLMGSIEYCLHGYNDHTKIVEQLVQKGVNPFVELTEPKHVRCNGKTYSAKSPMELVQILLPLDVFPEDRLLQDEDKRDELARSDNEKHRIKFQAFADLFSKYQTKP